MKVFFCALKTQNRWNWSNLDYSKSRYGYTVRCSSTASKVRVWHHSTECHICSCTKRNRAIRDRRMYHGHDMFENHTMLFEVYQLCFMNPIAICVSVLWFFLGQTITFSLISRVFCIHYGNRIDFISFYHRWWTTFYFEKIHI